MSSYVVDVELQLKIDKMVAELEKIPGVSTREAKKMAAAWSRDYKQTEKAAERMARNAERQAERVREGWKSSAERTASLMGGVFGDISDSVLDLGDRMAGVADDMGGLAGGATLAGGAVAALTAATVFGVSAMLEWMDSIDEVKKSLERVRGVPPLSPEHKRALIDYQEAARDADAAIAAATLTMQADFAPALMNVQHALVGVSATMTEITGESWSFSDALTGQARRMADAGIASAALVRAYDYFVDVGAEASAEIRHVSEAQFKANKAFREGSDEIRVTNDELNEYAEALGYVRENVVDLDDAERKRKDAAREAAEAERKRWADGAAQIAAAIRLEAELGEAAARREEQQQAAQEKGEESWDAQRKALQASLEGYEDLKNAADEYAKKINKKVKETYLAAMSAMASNTADFVENEIQYHIDALIEEEHQVRRVHRREMQRLEDAKEAVKQQIEAGKISKEEGKAELKRIDEEMRQKRRARRDDRKAQKEALQDAFKAQKAAARARAIVDAAANAVALTAAFAYAGPAAPGLALGVAGTQLAVQLAAIRAQKAPKFATGGMVRDRIEGDHAMISASPDEAILTPRGVDNAGGPAGVDALNRGSASGGGPTRVYLDGRMLGEVVARVIESDRQVGAALDRRIGAVAGIAR